MSASTYRNRYGDLVCAVHHVRLIVPPPRRDLAGKVEWRQPEPWCPSCRSGERADAQVP